MASGDWKALLKAVQEGDRELARHYIYEGVDINYEHPEMMTTFLIESVQAGREEMTALALALIGRPLVSTKSEFKGQAQPAGAGAGRPAVRGFN